MAAGSAEVEELSVGQKCTKCLDFEAYLAKSETSTYKKFAKDEIRLYQVLVQTWRYLLHCMLKTEIRGRLNEYNSVKFCVVIKSSSGIHQD